MTAQDEFEQAGQAMHELDPAAVPGREGGRPMGEAPAPSVATPPRRSPDLRLIPRAVPWDGSRALLADPYRFIGRTCRQLGTEVFETRLLLQRTLCMSGTRAAEVFYDTRWFQRQGAAPEAVRATLFGKGGVQGLDGARHRQRKALFVQVTGAHQVAALVDRVRHEWTQALPAWSAGGPVSLYRALQPVLARAVCGWAGVPLPEHELPRRTAQLVALFDSAAGGPAAHLQSRLARLQAEGWLSALLEDARAGRLRLPVGSAAHVVCWYREGGKPLPARVAAVELLNLLRPTVAVSVYITFVAHALESHPAWSEALAGSGPHADALGFVQEVRRHYPFFPVVAARVRENFQWDGLVFVKGRRALLDLYGTNHDARVWDEPEAFRPERWRGLAPGRFEFVPQGGAEVATHHRCPGEDIATQIMLLSIDMLLRRMRFALPQQDLRIAMDRLPALPRDGFLIDASGARAPRLPGLAHTHQESSGMNQISDVMTRNVRTVAPGDSMQRAAQCMDELNVGVIPVCDGDTIVGMVTDRDLAVRGVAAGKPADRTPVSEVMSQNVRYCFEDQDVDEVMDEMRDVQIRRIPVVTRDKRLVGIVSLGDVAARGSDDRRLAETLKDISTPSEPDRPH